MPHAPLCMRQHSLLPHAPLHNKSCALRIETCRECCLFVFEAVFFGGMDRGPCTLFYSLRKLTVQGKSQTLGASSQMIYALLLFSLGYVFILFCNIGVGFHEKLNLFLLRFHDEPLRIRWIILIKFLFSL